MINYDVNMLVYAANSLNPKYEYFFYGYSNTWILFHFNCWFDNYVGWGITYWEDSFYSNGIIKSIKILN